MGDNMVKTLRKIENNHGTYISQIFGHRHSLPNLFHQVYKILSNLPVLPHTDAVGSAQHVCLRSFPEIMTCHNKLCTWQKTRQVLTQ